MPKWMPNTNNQVATMVKEKQQLEVDLGKAILDQFNQPALIGPLRGVAKIAALEMVQNDDKIKKATEGAVAEEKKAKNAFLNNAEFQKALTGAANALEASIDKFSAMDVSNVIRLYGAYIEQLDPNKRKDKDSLRLDFTNRNRWRDQKQLDNAKDFVTKGKASPFLKNLIAKYETGGMSEFFEVQNALIRMEGGQAAFRLEFDSRILKLDTWFGLVSASDISGTTTDTLYFLNVVGGVSQALDDPIFRMLPLGTIVSGAHHSMIEVALPLSQNGFNDYSIGEYSSLAVKSSHASKGAIDGALNKFEADKRNHLMLVGWTGDFKKIVEIESRKKADGKAKIKSAPDNAAYNSALKDIKVDGAYVFDPSEKAAFFTMANAKKLHALMDKEHAWPTHANLREWLKKNGFPKTE